MTDRLRAALARADDPRTDGQLVTAYRADPASDAGERAFAELVRRHGPRVLGVCRRVTGQAEDAEDACQATFLVLARRAADIDPPAAVGGWLYGVAFRTAREARKRAVRRRGGPPVDLNPDGVAPVDPLDAFPAPTERPHDFELAAALDAAIAGLPDRLRAAVLLCELEGVSRKAAAVQLGVAEGTLSSRLADARKRLAAALRRNGFALPAALAGVVPAAAAGPSHPALDVACRLGLAAAAGHSLTAGAPVALADTMTKLMFARKLTAVLAAVTVAGAILAGWAFSRPTAAQDPKPIPKAVPQAEVKPDPEGEPKPVNRVVLIRNGKIVMLDPDKPKDIKTLVEPGKGEDLLQPTLSAGGEGICYLSVPKPPAGKEPKEPPLRSVMLREVGGEKASVEVLRTYGGVTWGPDIELLLVGPKEMTRDGEVQSFYGGLLDLETQKVAELPVPVGHCPLKLAADGKSMLTVKRGVDGWKPSAVLYRVSRDGKAVEPLTDPAYLAVQGDLSPDGKTVLFSGLKVADDPEKMNGRPLRPFVQPVGGKVTELAAPAGATVELKWSPDGKRIAYLWRQTHDKPAEVGKADDRDTEERLVVCDADGKNHRTLITEKGKGQLTQVLTGLDWR